MTRVPALAIATLLLPAAALQAQPYSGCGGSTASGQLQLSISSLDRASRTVVVDGLDSRNPKAPFGFYWGDTYTSGLFPQTHAYSVAGQNFVLQVQSMEDDGSTDCAQINITLVDSPPPGVITTIAGTGLKPAGTANGDGGPATAAALNSPTGLALETNGDLLVADSGNHLVRKISATAIITTIAGTGASGFTGDGGPAVAAALNNPLSVAIDASGSIYIADYGNNRVRRIGLDGTISTVAGNGKTGFAGDGGPATAASLSAAAVAVDPAGNLFIADPANFRIRKVTADGVISTAAGSGPGSCPVGNPFFTVCGGFGGDGGPATSALLSDPSDVAVDAHGELIINDAGNGRVRRVTPDGIIQSIAGGDSIIYDPHTPPIFRDDPGGVAVDGQGNVYYSDTFYPIGVGLFALTDKTPHDAKVSMITPAGVITTVAGGIFTGSSGDGGWATDAALNWPAKIVKDPAGTLFIADTVNNRIREVLASPPSFQNPAPSGTLSLSGLGGGKPETAKLTVTAVRSPDSPLPVPGMSYTAQVTGGATWLSVAAAGGVTPGPITVTADPYALNPGAYQGSLTITIPNAQPQTQTVNVQLGVSQGPGPIVRVRPERVSFADESNSAASSQSITVANAGSGPMPFTASVSLVNGQPANWLTVSAAAGTATPTAPVPLSVTATPTGLTAGTYTGLVFISTGSGMFPVLVTMTVTANPLILAVSPGRLDFHAVQNGPPVPSQTFSVANLGSGTMNWTLQTSVGDGGPTWLVAAPASGSSASGSDSPSLVAVNVDPSGLPAGSYRGRVKVIAAGAANTPQVVDVVLRVNK